MDRYHWLELQLDRDDLTDAEFDLYNKELNDLQDLKNRCGNEMKQQRIAKELERLAILATIVEMSEQGRMADLVDTYGQDFIGEYTINEQHEVRSFAHNNRNPDQQKLWKMESHDAAVKKMHVLIYYRIYDRYFRSELE